VQHISDLHLKFALRPHNVWKYGKHPIFVSDIAIFVLKRDVKLQLTLSDIQSATAEVRRGKRRRRKKKKPQGKNIMVCPIP